MGTDWTRAVAFLTYKEGVDAFRLTDCLSDSDRTTLMGGSCRRSTAGRRLETEVGQQSGTLPNTIATTDHYSAWEAIQALRLEMKFDLAFLDIEGDEGAGFQLAQTIRKHRPTVRVVLAAGVPRAAAEAGELCEQGPTQREPYDHRTLEKHIRRLLAR